MSVCLSLYFVKAGFSQHQQLKFERLSIEHGLSQSTVGYIYQDSRGFLWIAASALHKYDGYKITVYKHDPEDPTSLSNNDIWHIAEDTTGALWIGTYGGGLNRFDRETETFSRWQHDSSNSKSIASDYIICLLVDDAGVLWLGTEDAGLLRAKKTDSTTLIFTQWVHDTNDPHSLSGNEVICLYEDTHDTLWVGTSSGLNRFDRATGRFTRFFNEPDNASSLSSNYIEGIAGDDSGTLWIATHGGGLNRYDRSTEAFTSWEHQPGNARSPSTNFLYAIQLDHQGIIWIGTDNAGLDRFDPVAGTFANYHHSPSDLNSLSDNEVISMLEDRSGVLWIGTSEGGLSRLNPKHRTPGAFVHWKHNPSDPHSLSNNRILSFYEDKEGYIWIATTRGLNRFEHESGLFDFYAVEPGNPASLSNYLTSVWGDTDGIIWVSSWGGGVHLFDPKLETFTPFHYSKGRISTLLEDQFGTMWIGSPGEGLHRFDRKSGTLKILGHDPGNSASLSNNDVQCLYEDHSGDLWIGTHGGGLNKFDRKIESFEHWQTVSDDAGSLSNNIVRCIYEDKVGRLWIGTAGGLNKFDRESGRFKRYGERDGLPEDVVSGILEDDAGNLWLSTQGGLSKFNPKTETFRNYSVQDGLQSNEFNRGVSLKSSSGEMFFGGINGFNSFYPDSIKDNPVIPPVVITDFQVLNKSVKISQRENTPLRKHISETKEIVLSYSDRIFSFEYAALDYNVPERNQYAYMMEGFDQNWVTSGTKRFATYTNLDPGEYIFRVKGSNSDGVWNEKGASIKIIITPPWWLTWWAYTLYVVLIASLIYVFRQFELRKVRLAHDLQMQQFEAEKLRELDQMKSQFFANISHEFRTPLTLIVGPLQRLLSGEFRGNAKDQFRMMLRNGQHLLRLINQLLDLSKLDAGKMSLQTRPENVVTLLRQIVSAFDSLAKFRQITFTFQVPEEPLIVYIDRDKLEKIMNNLLANAFKFTPDQGRVTVSVNILSPKGSTGGGMLEIRVRDSGIGIPPDKLEKMFDRFYQLDSSRTHAQEGTGIGLALTKELVELHGGTIRVESRPGQGSTFIIGLLLGKEHLKADEITMELPESMVRKDIHAELTIPTKSLANRTRRKSPSKELPMLLIVDDNRDMRDYMREVLDQDYDLIEADNAKDGLATAVEHIPDLIISDVMMQEMDGFELCQKLKSDEHTCHVPVILLTARASDQSKMTGLETGADDFLTKPFNARELHLRIKNLILQRQKLRELFGREITLLPQEVAVTSMDAQFLERVQAIIEEHLADTDFTPEQFARKVAMSRMQLHRKLRALTNQSAGEFIRTMRLKRAAQLLQRNSGTIAEIAYEVGFNNPSYFAKCFKDFFGKLPSEFAG
jgi:signal transduction histidine kinase/ligand-binding sensor domain-containing protein/DNA-binding response OmpR family regulator